MGARPDGAPGAVECCGRRLVRLLAFLFLVCACLVMAAMVATTDGGASLAGPSSNSAASSATKTGGSPAWRSGGTAADAFRSSERRIPKGPDPIHNRRAGKTTTAPRRRD
ncbi:uncharacterized protein LOC100277301 [Zea mays]|uniref:Uncharacterized protein n=1 Tax=Zea mays TaxID=4577 RepID=B6TSI6_MAIZE|nr:uncharacterized protein LOC100277301 [Zea mays]ACG40069.1 hypothetical protein [Zea mays]|eukprot:NP_001144378.1 uncharacterized protein LOC100277301 [Zea mays]